MVVTAGVQQQCHQRRHCHANSPYNKSTTQQQQHPSVWEVNADDEFNGGGGGYCLCCCRCSSYLSPSKPSIHTYTPIKRQKGATTRTAGLPQHEDDTGATDSTNLVCQTSLTAVVISVLLLQLTVRICMCELTKYI